MNSNIEHGRKTYTCNNRDEKPEDAGYFFPVFNGALKKDGDKVHITEGRCFSDITYTLHYVNA